MRVLKFTLLICAIAGCWQPLSWTSLFKRILYIFNRITMIFILCTFNITQFMNIVLNVDNSNDFTATMYMMLTVFVAVYKVISMWVNHKKVMTLIDFLTDGSFAPLGSCEIKIRQKYDKMVKNTTLSYLILVMTTCVYIAITSFFLTFMKDNLPYQAWLPFNYKAQVVFFLVYVHQLMGVTGCAIVNVACDSLVCGFLLHICCQLEILENRLTKISDGPHVLHNCVYHHNRIYKYAYIVNNHFTKIIALQFAVSMLVVCSNLYQLAVAPIDASAFAFILYTACMLAQIFIYCWFGNKVKLKSIELADNIYNMEWTSLNNSSKKNLLLIMRRSVIPIEFTSAVIITLNLESFVAVLKASYSVFNLLKRTQ